MVTSRATSFGNHLLVLGEFGALFPKRLKLPQREDLRCYHRRPIQARFGGLHTEGDFLFHSHLDIEEG
jgi:hypothetical protein